MVKTLNLLKLLKNQKGRLKSMGFFRPTYAEINLGNLIDNYNAVKSRLPADCGVMAMVKADAYGHGAVEVSKRLSEAGVTALGVATVEEGMELRESGISTPIVVMGGLMGMGSKASEMIIKLELIPVVHSIDGIKDLDSAASSFGKVIGIHLKIDSGMSRLGLLPSGLDGLLGALERCRNLKLEGVMTHFSDAEDEEYTSYQMQVFEDAVRRIENRVGKVGLWHVANSAAVIEAKYIHRRNGSKIWVRPGLMLYGAYPSTRYEKLVQLKPVMSLKSRIALVKTLPEGTKVSYACTFETKRRTKAAIIPIGYADGYPWSLSNKGVILVSGQRAPIIGRVTMDMIIADITDTDGRVGDEVILMGQQGDEKITVEEIATLSGTISYEIFCRVSKRMPRVYVGQ